MGQTYKQITRELRQFISAQRMFFVATAPLSPDARINLSPKGLDTFRVIDEHTVAYLDLTGSGNETSAHLEENGRITFMFCAFEGPPNIVRLYGRGQTVLPDDPQWNALRPSFGDVIGQRQIIVATIDRASTSCGFAVPRFTFSEDRGELIRYAEKKGADGLEQYRREKNVRSIDGMITTFGKSLDSSCSSPRRGEAG